MWWSRAGSPPTAWFCHSWRTTESRSSAEDAWSSARHRWHPENTNHFEKFVQRVLTLAGVSGEVMTQQSIEFKLRTNHCFAMPFSSNVVKNVKVSQDCCVSSSSLSHSLTWILRFSICCKSFCSVFSCSFSFCSEWSLAILFDVGCLNVWKWLQGWSLKVSASVIWINCRSGF